MFCDSLQFFPSSRQPLPIQDFGLLSLVTNPCFRGHIWWLRIRGKTSPVAPPDYRQLTDTTKFLRPLDCLAQRQTLCLYPIQRPTGPVQRPGHSSPKLPLIINVVSPQICRPHPCQACWFHEAERPFIWFEQWRGSLLGGSCYLPTLSLYRLVDRSGFFHLNVRHSKRWAPGCDSFPVDRTWTFNSKIAEQGALESSPYPSC